MIPICTITVTRQSVKLPEVYYGDENGIFAEAACAGGVKAAVSGQRADCKAEGKAG